MDFVELGRFPFSLLAVFQITPDVDAGWYLEEIGNIVFVMGLWQGGVFLSLDPRMDGIIVIQEALVQPDFTVFRVGRPEFAACIGNILYAGVGFAGPVAVCRIFDGEAVLPVFLLPLIQGSGHVGLHGNLKG